MSLLSRALPLSLALALSFTSALVTAEPSSVEATQSEERLSSAEATPEAQDAANLACVAVRCSSEAECWNACPTAQDVACVNNGCKYTLPGGGGGGGGGPTCPATRCIDDSDCICSGRQGYCDVRVCRY
ncbi:hypothetical protein LZ198_26205 [Myxococcus sp. K15C18031901]|uniref:hypothetical protein n=1 Tax=Myxococcus dinghuensis TaxID=2906761 RepID=UPI0020A7D9E4|nr:hypothetical protein [Myxococcus dinghuensis]MCP3102369.1 hypothetical protein [Myxococcus dinghuensis]